MATTTAAKTLQKGDKPSTLSKKILESERTLDVGRLHEPLVQSAVSALLQHHAKSTDPSKDLLGNDTVVQVQFGLEVAPKQAHVKPIRLDIPHGFHLDEDDAQVCLIVKQDSKAWVKELLSQFPEMKCVKKVLGLESLRNKYGDYVQRRQLLHSYNVFMADDSILPMLSKALGKIFFKAKRQPIPVPVARKSALPYHILKALRSTHLSYAKGTSITVVAGRTNMEVAHLVANVVALVPQAVAKLPRQWANVRSLALKTPASMALPIYNKTPEELLEIARLANVTPAWTEPAPESTDEETPDPVRKPALFEVLQDKSPLVRALQKQKKQNQSKRAAPLKPWSINNSGATEDSPKSIDKPSTKAAEKRKMEQLTNERLSEDSKVDTKEGVAPSDLVEAAESQQKSTKKTLKRDKSQGMRKTEVSATKEAKEEDQIVSKKQRKSKASADNVVVGSETFFPSKSYDGSKAGFVFKNGPRGVGYYVDVKPVVDRMAIDAFWRMAEQANHSSSRVKKSKSPRRGRR